MLDRFCKDCETEWCVDRLEADAILKPWNMVEECRVCDGCSYRLDITYCDGRKKSHMGDIGGGTIDKLVMDFLESIPEMKRFCLYRRGRKC